MIYGMEEVLVNTGAPTTRSSLPEFLRPPQRLASRSPSYDDFLMLTEFTEVLGPVPLPDYIIPDRECIESDFNLNLDDFSIKIMSADYFAQATLHDNAFRMPEPMHALISNAHTHCYTLLYAFTLYDIHARGYVRPLYLAYTSSTREKIVYIYEMLIQALTQAVHMLVHCNIRKFADELQYGELPEGLRTAQTDVRYLSSVQDVVRAKLSSMNDCCPPLMSCKSRSVSDASDYEVVSASHGTSLRPVIELSDYWQMFHQELYKIYKTFSCSTSQILKCVREEKLACDTFNSLNIGGRTVALLKCQFHINRRCQEAELEDGGFYSAHKDSIVSVESVGTASSITSLCSSTSASTVPSVPTSMHQFSGPSSISSDPGIDSLISELRVEGAAGGQGPYLLDSEATIKGVSDYYSVSTDSLNSGCSSLDGCIQTAGDWGGRQSASPSNKFLTSRSPLPMSYICLKELISADREHIRDLVFSVMTCRPLVLVEPSKSKQLTHERVASALATFVPHQNGENKHGGYHVVVEDLTLKSICTQPITCFLTNGRNFKIADSIKACASIYYIQNKSYEGLLYDKRDSSKAKNPGLLDLFYRKRRHKTRFFLHQVESFLTCLATKAQLLHSLLQHTTQRLSDSELLDKLHLTNPCDLDILKNLVHVVLRQQYVNSQGLKEADISATSLSLTLS